jgi:hypothetical protein
MRLRVGAPAEIDVLCSGSVFRMLSGYYSFLSPYVCMLDWRSVLCRA